jgi:YD repeat-containing protein
MSRCPVAFFISAIALHLAVPIFAQSPVPNSNDTIRVTVTVNADGSRTTYQYDNAKHEAIATTADPDGKARGKVVYRIDDVGHFASGVVFGPDGKFQFKTIYKYDGAGRLEQETHLAKDDSLVNKIVYKYDPAGKQIGYSVFDSAGKLISGTVSPSPTPRSKPRNSLGH